MRTLVPLTQVGLRTQCNNEEAMVKVVHGVGAKMQLGIMSYSA